ncbi:MAG: caspase family protein, partial [Deltaproteobacteria bacterium]|nr:caspase family protein [Deltaproteobacteria bacterium]
MNRSIVPNVVLAMVVFLSAGSALATTSRFALIVGNNRGGEDEDTLRYATRDARKIYNLLTQLGRFKKENTFLQLDGTAKSFWQNLDTLEKKAARAQAAGNDTMLLIYYSGHARSDALELGDTEVAFRDLRHFLERSKMQVRLAFVDSCHSGQLIAAKGAKKGLTYRIDVNDEISSAGYAIITSSARNELSQESRELRGAFFTHHLASALRGNGDSSKDGKVTLQEAYEYAYQKTLSQTAGSAGVSQHPMYHFQLKGRGDIVLTHTRRSGSAVEIPFIEPGRIMLLDGMGEEVLAEAASSPGESVRFNVPPGPYTVYIVKKSGAVRIAEADVPPHQTTMLGPDDFTTTTLVHAVAKGGLFKTPEYKWIHKIGIFALKQSAPLDGISSPWGAGLHYRLQHESGIQPSAQIFTTSGAHRESGRAYYDVGMALGIGYVFQMDFLLMHMSVALGYTHMFQDEAPTTNLLNERPHTSAFSATGNMGFEFPISMIYLFADVGAGGRIFQVVNRGWVPRFEFQGMAGAGFTWGAKWI